MDNDDNTRSFVPLTKGVAIGQYQIIEKIGSGGMGEVYLANDTKLDRRVALKFLPAGLVSDTEVKARFVREARAAAKLHHPHIVTVYEVGEYGDRPFIAMEFVDGKQLDHLARDESLDIATIVEYAIQLCQGLGEAHRAGIVHRDIKSANIAVDNSGRTRILDFGLAAVQGTDALTKTGSTLGTVSYMSPEQVSGREVDRRSDLFSLGIVLYELITTQTPFKRNNEGATLRAIMEEMPEPLARFRANVPDPLQNIVSKLLEKDREHRYQTAEGVLADLKKMLYDSSQSTVIIRARGKQSNRVVPILISTVAVSLIVVWALFFRGSSESEEQQLPVLILLPFTNLGSAADDYFSEGITEEISSRLISMSELRVISQGSARKYKESEKSVAEIGQEVGADFVLEGTIRWDKSGQVDRIRISPRLTRTSNDYLMWADIYEEELLQIFDVQSKIAEQIVEALGLTLLHTGSEAPEHAPTTNMAAYNYYLRGLDIGSRGVYLADLSAAINMYDSALLLDSNFAQAWARKSAAHSDHWFAATTKAGEYNRTAAREAARKALALEPNLIDGHIAMGSYYNLVERDYDAALEEFAKAKSELTSNSNLLEAIGLVKMRQGKWQEALTSFEQSAQNDPLSVRRYFFLALGHSMVRDYSKAEEYLDRALALAPDDPDAVFFKAYMNLLIYGSVDSDDVTFDSLVSPLGIARIAAYELASSTAPGLWRFLEGRYDPEQMRSDLRSLAVDQSTHVVYLNLAQIFDLDGQPDSARVYYELARTDLSVLVDEGYADFHTYDALGHAFAFMGMADSAIAAGKMAKELMSVDDCHW